MATLTCSEMATLPLHSKTKPIRTTQFTDSKFQPRSVVSKSRESEPNQRPGGGKKQKGKSRQRPGREEDETRFGSFITLQRCVPFASRHTGSRRLVSMSFAEVLFELLVVLIKTLGTVFVALFRVCIPEPFKSVREKVVLVTGSAGGLGRQLAQKFALLGAKVVLVDVDETRNNETLQSIKSMQCKGYAYTCDVSNENQVEALADRVYREVGDVDILINNAGVLPGKPLLELTNAQIKKTFAVNSMSHMWMIRQFLPRMLDRGEGHIAAIASVAGILGCSYLVDYCASKHAVIGLMSALQEELHEMGREEQIQLTVVCPTTMNTGMVQNPKTRFPSLLPILDVDKASDIVVQSILRNKRLVVIPTTVHVIYKICNLFPPQVPLLLQRFLGYTIDPNVK